MAAASAAAAAAAVTAAAATATAAAAAVVAEIFFDKQITRTKQFLTETFFGKKCFFGQKCFQWKFTPTPTPGARTGPLCGPLVPSWGKGGAKPEPSGTLLGPRPLQLLIHLGFRSHAGQSGQTLLRSFGSSAAPGPSLIILNKRRCG